MLLVFFSRAPYLEPSKPTISLVRVTFNKMVKREDIVDQLVFEAHSDIKLDAVRLVFHRGQSCLVGIRFR